MTEIREAWRPLCEVCGRSFGDATALYSHTKAKHGRKAARAVRPPRRDDDEQSIASDLVEAIQVAQAGEPVPEYLLTMFPESFPRGTAALRRAQDDAGTGGA